MTQEKKDDVTIYTETPQTGINNGVEITPSAKQEQKVEQEAENKLVEKDQKAKQDQVTQNDSSGEAG